MNKKLFFSLFAATGMLFATSCSNDELECAQSGNEAQVTFSLGLEGGIATRAISDGTGAKKLVCAVYDANETLLDKVVINNKQVDNNGQYVNTDAFKGGLTDNISITLAKGQTYTIAFWAQNGDCNAYDTDNLKAVKVDYTNGAEETSATGDINNDDTRDAFFAAETFKVEGNKEINVTLKRPFAQINVGVYQEDWDAAVASGIEIEKSSVVIKNVADQINLLTGAVEASEAMENGITYTLGDIPDETLYVETDATKDGKEAYVWLSMSYILVNDGSESAASFDGTQKSTLNGLQYTFAPEENKGQPIAFSEGLAGAPVRRNWRTNILGKILTGDIQFNITIDPVYDGDYIYPDGTAEQELEMAAIFGGTVTLNEDLTLTKALNVKADMILNIADGKTLTGSINVANGANLSVNGGAINNTDENTSGIVSNGYLTLNNVEITSARHALRIESGNVVINGGTYKVVPTSNKTLYALNVGDDNTTANVTIKGGTFIGPKGTMADSGGAVAVKANSTVTIEGGDFSGGKNNTLSSKGTLTVTGGTFDQDPTTYVADGYKAAKSGDNYIVVTEETSVVSTSEDLVNAFKAGGQVILADNVELEGVLTVEAGAEVYLDMNGKTMTVAKDADPAFYTYKGSTLVIDGNGTVELTVPALSLLFPGGDVVIENGTFVRTVPEGTPANQVGALFVGAKVSPWGSQTVTINGGYFDGGYYNADAADIDEILAGTKTFTETEDDIAKRGNSKDTNKVRVAIKQNVQLLLNLSYNLFKIYGGTFVGANPAWGDEGCMLPTTPNYLRPWSYYQGALLDGQEFNENGIVLPEGYTITKGAHEDGRPTYTVSYSK